MISKYCIGKINVDCHKAIYYPIWVCFIVVQITPACNSLGYARNLKLGK